MVKFRDMSNSDKKEFAGLVLWFAAGAAMVITGVLALINHAKTVNAVSGVLGVCALITGIITLLVRFYQLKVSGKRAFSLDGLIWIVIALLLFNTNILSKLGKLAFIIGGVVMLVQGVRSFFAARRAKSESEWYIPRMIFSVIFIALGIIVIANAQRIFEGMIVLAIGVYFIVHGTIILYDWIGRAKYFHNFIGLDK